MRTYTNNLMAANGWIIGTGYGPALTARAKANLVKRARNVALFFAAPGRADHRRPVHRPRVRHRGSDRRAGRCSLVRHQGRAQSVSAGASRQEKGRGPQGLRPLLLAAGKYCLTGRIPLAYYPVWAATGAAAPGRGLKKSAWRKLSFFFDRHYCPWRNRCPGSRAGSVAQ